MLVQSKYSLYIPSDHEPGYPNPVWVPSGLPIWLNLGNTLTLSLNPESKYIPRLNPKRKYTLD